jgi:hypothetical protein
MSIPPASDQTHKKRKFGGSGEIEEKDIPIVESTYTAIVESIDTLLKLKNGKYSDLGDLLELQGKAKGVLQSVRTLKGLQESPENLDCDVNVCILQYLTLR